MSHSTAWVGRFRGVLRVRVLALAACALVLSPTLGLAQFPALPFFFRPLHDPYPSFAVHAEYGIGLADISELNYLGARGSIESEKLRFSLSLGSIMLEGGADRIAAAATFAYNFRGPIKLVVVDGQVGVGYSEFSDVTAGEFWRLDLPVGVGVGLHAPLPLEFLSNVEPWAALRGHIRYTGFSGASDGLDAWRGGGGLSAGLRLIHPSGLGVHGGVDWLVIRSASVNEWDSEVGIAFGAQWRW